MSGFTPMIEQYRSIKKEYAVCILFFRLGDFYEMFFEDAEIASRALEIVLTGRDGGREEKIPMCGVPYHAANNYIGKLLEKGYRVAICDQVEDPKQAKGIVKREVTRVVTPGTALEEAWLKDDNNYLVAVVIGDSQAALAYVDISTAEFGTCQFTGTDYTGQLRDELTRLKPSECLVSQWSGDSLLLTGDELKNMLITELAPEFFTKEQAREQLERHFGRSIIAASGLNDMPEALQAAGAILGFIEKTQKTSMNHLKYIRTYEVNDYMNIDRASRRNLELTASMRDGQTAGSLLGVIDRTRTGMGRRQLRSWLDRPLLDCRRINERLDAVEELLKKRLMRENLQDLLASIRDLERIAARVGAGIVNPRETLALKACLESVPALRNVGTGVESPLLMALFNLDQMPDLLAILDQSIDDNAPISTKDGGIIKEGYDEMVDELRKIAFAGDKWLIDYEAQEKERTGIKSLKVGYNKVFGYYIEITKSNLQQAPQEYVRKQTLVNAERFITEELKKFENEVLGAKEKLYSLEQSIFDEIRRKLQGYIEPIQTLGMQIAQLDVVACLAETAFLKDYHRPEVMPSGPISIKGGRHPVVESALGELRFVPNDTHLDPEGERLGIITGPNMGGKSTYLRQVALIAVLAQMGSFVPADEARIGLVDRLFTRVGASDDLAAGQSTFMVEMSETANIIRNLSPRSLVLLDEIGRGTSTFDGMSIARAIAEYLSNVDKARILFATHYHELTDLADKFRAAFNLCVSVKESGEEVVFLKKVMPGRADKSYGIHVARLAGLPNVITDRAEQILNHLEETREQDQHNREIMQQSLFEETNHPIIEALGDIDINNMTPVEALTLLQEWKKSISQPKGGLRLVRG
ncbi:MAG: DNA mismatch repair protein MutS [Candidatus Saccharibacteria bacterium]